MPHLIPPLACTAFIFVCRAKLTSVRLPLQRTAEQPAFLKIGCAERPQNRSTINYSPSEIFISQRYLQTPVTITRVSQPIPHSCWRHGDSQYCVLNIFCPCSLYMDVPPSWSESVIKNKYFQLTWPFVCLFTLKFSMPGRMFLFNCHTLSLFKFHFLSNLFSGRVRCVKIKQ